MDNKILKLNAIELQKYQQNRYPFLLIDGITEVLPGKYANGFKHLTNNEWYFPVHFPGEPNVPGALQVEAMAQVLTVAITTLPGLAGSFTRALKYIVSFKREVLPGERLDMETKVLSWKRGICKGIGSGYVDGELAVEAEMTITIPEVLHQFTPKGTK